VYALVDGTSVGQGWCGFTYHADDECADEVKTSFLTALAGDLVLRYTIISRHFRDWTKEEMCTVG
jgi:hypothetical protein